MLIYEKFHGQVVWEIVRLKKKSCNGIQDCSNMLIFIKIFKRDPLRSIFQTDLPLDSPLLPPWIGTEHSWHKTQVTSTSLIIEDRGLSSLELLLSENTSMSLSCVPACLPTAQRERMETELVWFFQSLTPKHYMDVTTYKLCNPRKAS